MMFVQRTANKIVGVFANRQPGFAEEMADDNAPEVLAFLGQSQRGNWRGFAGAMMDDAGYDRVTNIVMGLSVSKGKIIIINLTTAIAYENPNPAIVKRLWNDMVNYLTLLQKPTTAEVTEWQRLADLYSVPLKFGSGGVVS